MYHGFFKINRGENLNFLLQHPKECAFMVWIASRARIIPDERIGLQIGECIVSDYDKINLTEQKYRTVKKNLVKWKFATFRITDGLTGKITVASLVDTSIFHVNAKNLTEDLTEDLTEGQRKVNGRSTEPLTTNKNVKKEKNVNNVKNIYMHKAESFYNKYPPKRAEGGSTGKSRKDIDKIISIYEKGEYDLDTGLDLYLANTNPKYYKNLSVWLNNLPDIEALNAPVPKFEQPKTEQEMLYESIRNSIPQYNTVNKRVETECEVIQ